jgi:uncharacterized protein YecT (DUF1311 family)
MVDKRENDRAENDLDARPYCKLKSCPSFDVAKYLHQLQQTLPQVPPISGWGLKSLHEARDYEGMVRLVRKTMNVEVKLKVGWVNSGGNENAPAWIKLPSEMPIYGSRQFREMTLEVFFRKSFLEQSTYDQVASAVAHELSHVVLESIRHPLRKCEKAVDLTAMLLGFSRLYETACHTEERVGNSIRSFHLGYLSEHELQIANELLTPVHLRSKIKELRASPPKPSPRGFGRDRAGNYQPWALGDAISWSSTTLLGALTSGLAGMKANFAPGHWQAKLKPISPLRVLIGRYRQGGYGASTGPASAVAAGIAKKVMRRVSLAVAGIATVAFLVFIIRSMPHLSITSALVATSLDSKGQPVGISTDFPGPRAFVVAYFEYENGNVGVDTGQIVLDGRVGSSIYQCKALPIAYPLGSIACKFPNELGPGVYMAGMRLNGSLIRQVQFDVGAATSTDSSKGALEKRPSASKHMPSFDCKKATKWAEMQICANGDLAELDAKLGQLYAKRLSESVVGVRDRLRATQREWIQSRDFCQQVTEVGVDSSPAIRCLLDIYNDRLASLSGTLPRNILP